MGGAIRIRESWLFKSWRKRAARGHVVTLPRGSTEQATRAAAPLCLPGTASPVPRVAIFCVVPASLPLQDTREAMLNWLAAALDRWVLSPSHCEKEYSSF